MCASNSPRTRDVFRGGVTPGSPGGLGGGPESEEGKGGRKGVRCTGRT